MNKKIYTEEVHSLNPKQIQHNALKIINTLVDAGFEAYIVGGAVRDLLLKAQPKDFDIATNAHPEEIKRLFRNCRLVGRRFRLAHLLFGREIIEVATFRAASQDDDAEHERKVGNEGFLVRDNVYGTLEEDALRRDFTINALYYDPINNTVIDFIDGYQDLKDRLLKMIGEPDKRFREDPVRMLRAVRFEEKLGFTLGQNIIEQIAQMGYLLQTVSPARMFEEVIKLFLNGQGYALYSRLRYYHLFSQIFPLTERALHLLGEPESHLLATALQNSDQRVNDSFGASAYFLYAALLWEPFLDEYTALMMDGSSSHEASITAAHKILSQQQSYTLIPKRISAQIIDLWRFQFRLINQRNCKSSNGINRILNNPRFKAAYDFLLLRKEAFESNEIINFAKFWKSEWEKNNP